MRPVVVLQWIQPEEMPAKCPVVPEHSSFEGMGRPGQKSLLSFPEELFPILRMNVIQSGAFSFPFINIDTEVVERHPIGVKRLSIRPKDTNVLRCEVEDLPELHFLFLELLLCLLAFFDVEVDADPIQERAVLRSQRLGPTEEPPVLALGVTDSKTHFTRGTCTETG